jgi:D-alanyl-D-alanine dipeptidase
VKFFDYQKDGSDAWFVGFYKNKNDELSCEYQRLQDLLITVMLRNGFKLGVKNEVWHFEFKIKIKFLNLWFCILILN